MSRDSRLSDIKKDSLYFMPSGNVVRVVKVDYKNNMFILHNYHSHSNESIDMETGVSVMKRAYSVSQVARIVKKSTSTIRKYESIGLLSQPKKIFMKPSGNRPYRVYSRSEVDDIITFFEKRGSAGRPYAQKHDTMSKSDIKHRLDFLQKEKLNG